jgi:hypothetical protein
MHRPSIVLVIALVASTGCAATSKAPAPPPAATASTGPRLPDDPRVRSCAEASNDRLVSCEGSSGLREGANANPEVADHAFAYFNQSCQRGQAADCYRAMLYAGDPETFTTLGHRACELGFAIACTKLAIIVDGAAQDGGGSEVQGWALAFGQRGCFLGDAPACLFMGARLEAGGPGLPGDPTQAAAYFRIACEKYQDASACAKLKTLPAPAAP